MRTLWDKLYISYKNLFNMMLYYPYFSVYVLTLGVPNVFFFILKAIFSYYFFSQFKIGYWLGLWYLFIYIKRCINFYIKSIKIFFFQKYLATIKYNEVFLFSLFSYLFFITITMVNEYYNYKSIQFRLILFLLIS